jgi:hypothetical protein
LAWRQTVSVCGSTPATPSNTATAPSRTRSERSTSTVKSTWPGVSMMLMLWSRHWQVVAAEVMVMPRSCSCAIQSIVGGAFVDLTDLVVLAGVVEDPLGRRGLARVDVGHDPDVADSFEGVGALCVSVQLLSLTGRRPGTLARSSEALLRGRTPGSGDYQR